MRTSLIAFLLLVGCATTPPSFKFIDVDASAGGSWNAWRVESIYKKLEKKYEAVVGEIDEPFIFLSSTLNPNDSVDGTAQYVGRHKFEDGFRTVWKVNTLATEDWGDFVTVLEHEFKHVLFGQMTEIQRSEFFATEVR